MRADKNDRKAKYIFTAAQESGNGVTGGPIAVYTDADLKRRTDAAKKAGVRVNVRKI